MATITFDAASVRARILTTLRGKTSWATILDDATNTRLIDSLAEEIATLGRYDAYLTTENKWRLAQNRSSLVYASDLLGYTPKRQIAATGTLRFCTNKNVASTTIPLYDSSTTYIADDEVAYNGKIYVALQTALSQQPDTATTYWSRVPGYTYGYAIVLDPYSVIFSDGSNIKVCTVDTYTLNTTDDYVDIAVVQGEPKTQTFYAQGNSNESFTIDDATIAETYLIVKKNGVVQTIVTDLRLYSSTDTVCEIVNTPNYDGIEIVFGDDVFGKKLAYNDQIDITYISTLGISGNVTSSGIINTVVSSITDSNSNTVTTYCMNEDVIGGGKAIEDIETIRSNGPLVFQTGGRATSSTDYKTILQSFSYVSRAIVWGAYEYNIDNNLPVDTYVPTEENIVHVCAFTTAGVNLSSAQQSEVQTYLNSYKSPTDIIKFEDTEFVNLIFNVTAKVSDRSYPLSTVTNNITTGLSTQYDINNMEFNQSIYESDYKAYIDSIAGVSHHSTTVQLFNEYPFDSGYTLSWTFSSYPVTPNSVYIYVKLDSNAYTLAAIDDGTGGLIAQGTYNTSGSSLSYQYGGALLTISGGDLTQLYTRYTVKILYSIDSLDLELKKRNQIFKYSSANITSTYTTK